MTAPRPATLVLPTVAALATRERTQEMADDLFQMVVSGKVRIPIDQEYALADVAQAHRDLEARKTTGASVLKP